ncbi:Exodeoxyribonuclease VII large subunit [Alkalibacterium putridalgicola]|uniref:Exodeoxyribonuclease 7 large subunit n=1 Tax=Alkalibacterium putridalgicola TaxID=426703 RepID=A0A1H7SIE6_9LACT|nr:exodeoxyribonuclease VII large subunit [Alkalibacterium putridalgicola]GEK88760.1 exodeoxyribonuclease 7 large subunit [Alkalibacterium putridalgicola]SEL71474.1 Exodeoxyribonuclease VII large subunit [Alkalibacterium putridalgicola]
MDQEYLTVTQLTRYVKRKFDQDPYLERVFVKGEISNYNPKRRNRHQYFSIKDQGAKLSAVLFYNEQQKLGIDLEEGMSVLAVGRLSVYEKTGAYQLYVDHIEPEGLGQLYAAYEQTKKKLTEEGWFDLERKKPLKRFPKKIGIITSQSGAVIRDIQTTIERRFPIVELYLFPAVVQGDKAADSIVRSIRQADQDYDLDTLIVGRGGGSFEDLFPFNEEKVALAIANARTPVISSVGHETDTTLADLAADIRAATPTAAAELAVPVLTEEVGRIDQNRQRVTQAMTTIIRREKERVDRLERSYIFRQPRRLYDGYSQNLDQLTDQLIRTVDDQVKEDKYQVQLLDQELKAYHPCAKVRQAAENREQLTKQLMSAAKHYVKNQENDVNSLIQSLDHLSPLKILSRGYAIAQNEAGVVKSVDQVTAEDKIDITVADGSIKARVEETVKKEIE